MADATVAHSHARPAIRHCDPALAAKLGAVGAKIAARAAQHQHDYKQMTRRERLRWDAACKRARASRVRLVSGRLALIRPGDPRAGCSLRVRPALRPQTARSRHHRTRRVRPACTPRSGDDQPPGHQPGPRQPARGARA
jgi:hypothetical protein